MNRAKKAFWRRRLTFRIGRLRAARQRGDVTRARKWARSVEHAKRVLGLSPVIYSPTPRVNQSGVDVSGYDGDINWGKVRAAGHSFAFCKVSEGADFVDPSWNRERVAAMRLAGIKIGTYHFLRPREGRSGAVEARFYLETARRAGWGRKNDLRPVIDFEVTALPPTETLAYLAETVAEIKRLTNNTAPIIYTGKFFWDDNTDSATDNFGCPLWLAAYVKDPVRFIPAAWKRDQWSIWQHTETGRVDGIPAENVDQNLARSLPTI